MPAHVMPEKPFAEVHPMCKEIASGNFIKRYYIYSYSPSTYVHCDVTSEEDIKNLIDSSISKYGHLDIMYNNAGVLGNQKEHKKSIVNFDPNEFDKIMSVNVRGTALGMKHAARVMIPQGYGCIISTSSVAGVMGGLGPHAYTASKHAIIGLTKNVACELGCHGIRVNCISPFGVATSMLINAWKKCDEDEDDEENGMKFGVPCEEEVEKIEEFVRSMTNLRDKTPINFLNSTVRTSDTPSSSTSRGVPTPMPLLMAVGSDIKVRPMGLLTRGYLQPTQFLIWWLLPAR
ncbi:hypothetical protein RND71_038480 [Anisodus tanguticus]|uniref:Uncharacterized protein n=1 Tax=Anisodus tanguticus TaxID=243964 RepID=A0AAE1R0S2_9SOLA|nr:hypothetical protein RND71_038480 [Anisodus tanguticus]